MIAGEKNPCLLNSRKPNKNGLQKGKSSGSFQACFIATKKVKKALG